MGKQPRPPSRAGKGPTPGSFKPGISGNPAGRPRMSERSAFSERVRERVSPDLVIDLALAVANDETLDHSSRLTALWPLVDRGWVKPVTDVSITTSSSSESNWDGVPLERRRAALEALRAARRGPVVDDDTPSSENTEQPQHVAADTDA